MKFSSRLALAILAAVSLFISGCSGGDSHEKVVNDMTGQLDRMTNSLLAVTDKASAEKAATELKSVVEEFKKIGERAKKMGDPSADVKARLEASMKAKQVEVQTKMAGIGPVLMKAGPEAQSIVMKALAEFGPAMAEVGKVFSK